MSWAVDTGEEKWRLPGQSWNYLHAPKVRLSQAIA